MSVVVVGAGSSRRSMTRDINESIRLVLGKHIKMLLKVPVKLELKGGDKTENRIIVLSAHRLFVMTAKVPTRIDHHYHYLDFRRIESKRFLNQIVFTLSTADGKTHSYSFRIGSDPSSSEMVDGVIATLTSAVRNIFPGVPVEHVLGRIDVHPPERVREYVEWVPPDPKSVGPCGGFSSQYACMCDYYALPFREEVAWDVDTIYFSHDSHELCLQDFEHLDHRDLVCIISALEHNTWFLKLRTSSNSPKLPSDICDRILGVVAKSVSLQEIHVSSIGARWDFAAKLSQAMMNNPQCSLTSFDLSCNFLEDKGILHISNAVCKLAKGLRHVNLSHCSLTSKGISGFSQAMVNNRFCSSTLTYLNLCGNSMKEVECSIALCSFLAQPNVIAILDISSTETPLDILFNALVRGCTTNLTHLNLSRNPFSSKKAKDIPGAFKQFFAGTLSLQYINLSHCKLPPEALKNLLLGLACNEATTNVELNLSNNNLGANGAAVLESCIGGVKCVSRLDLSENNIEAEMAWVMNGISRNKSILSLNVSRNMTGIKPKYLSAVMESIVQLLQDEEASLTKLNLSDCKLKGEINNVINALGSNQCLQHLDIQGNGMGDVGARLLAKALQINTRLRIINLDRNNISLQGYTDITYALQSNYAMRHIPFPTYDMAPFMKTHPERVDTILHRLQELLQRNSSPHQFRNTAQAFRLTQGFILSSTQQILDRVAAQTQDNVEAMKKIYATTNRTNSEEEERAVVKAKGYIHDAENSKHLLSALHEVTTRREEIDLKMKAVASDLNEFIQEYVRTNVENMLDCAEKQCPTVMSNAILKAELRKLCQKKCEIQPDFVSNLITDQVGLEIHNKINELNLIVANNISDRVIDEVIESMTGVSKNISYEIGSYKKKRSLTPDVLKQGRPASESSDGGSSSQTPHPDACSQKSESSSPLSTPQTSKRKSLHDRKLRPKSIADSNVSNEEPPRGSNTPDLLSNASSSIQEEDSVPELPSVSALQHLGKARPKRPKKHAPTRGASVIHNDQEPLNEGLDKFFVAAAASPPPPTAIPPTITTPPNSSTPSGSPMLEDFPLRNRQESFSSTNSNLLKDSIEFEKSPLAIHKTPSTPSRASALSCLNSSAIDEDMTPPPEKKNTSPSISDIFSKSIKSNKDNPLSKSPSSPLDQQFRRRKSSLLDAPPSNEDEKPISPTPFSESFEAGKRTPEEAVRRVGVGLGGNMLAEMKAKQEKRSSVIVTTTTTASSTSTTSTSTASATTTNAVSSLKTSTTSSSEEKIEKNSVFGKVRLRSTGLAGSLTSPTNDYSPSDSSDDKKAIGGSIVGLRASKFSSSSSDTSPPTTTGTGSELFVPKPKPLPKPRPWSIVGVDRKSGEITSVSPDNNNDKQDNNNRNLRPKKSSVRDLINNMNKVENSSSISSSSSPPSNSNEARRKGNSLPRGVPPLSSNDHPSSSTSILSSTTTTVTAAAAAAAAAQGRSPKFTHSPNVSRKESRHNNESTCDDPRILKLEDDFAFEDVMDV